MINTEMLVVTLAIPLVLTSISLISAYAAMNLVPCSHLSEQSFTPNANALKPPDCAGLNLTCIVTGNGMINGTQDNDLILAGAGDDKLQGKNGGDCLVSGDGDDDLIGNNGWGVCIGGGGNDTFKHCKVEIQ